MKLKSKCKSILHISKWNVHSVYLKLYYKETFRLPLLKKYPDPTTLTITALEKLDVFEKYKGRMLLTEGMADNQWKGVTGSNQTLEKHLQVSAMCQGWPEDRQHQVSTVWATGAVSFSTGNQGDTIHI